MQAGSAPLRAVAGLLLLTGICLMLPVLAFAVFTDVDRAFVTIVLLTTATASVATTSGYGGLFLWFAAPVLLPLSLAWILAAPEGASTWAMWGMGGLIPIYLAFLVALGRDLFRVFDESCRIRWAEHSLNDRLALALEAAEQASQAKTRFLAAASHDLRQPLHTIGLLTATLGLRQLDARSRDMVLMLGGVNQTLSGQLDGLLDVSKLDAGIVKPDMQVHRIEQIVAEHGVAMQAVAQERGLYIRTHGDAQVLVLVLTDIVLMRRLLGNLTGNALKFTHHGGIDVFVSAADGMAVIEVADTGIGIAPEHQRLIFQEFYQVGNIERDRYSGLGLGLSIVQRLCALLGIELSIESVPGQGSRFTLRLPLLQAPRQAAPQGPGPTQSSPAQLDVMVVDDEMDVRQAMRFGLEELGCRVWLADGVAQARDMAQARHIDMVISDFRLRGQETGIEAVREVCALHPKAYALLVSGDTAPDRLQQALAAGISLLHKPVALQALADHVQQAKSTR
ncbi:MAG: ATP-binding protein [Betaproteobacteria bacterium]